MDEWHDLLLGVDVAQPVFVLSSTSRRDAFRELLESLPREAPRRSVSVDIRGADIARLDRRAPRWRREVLVNVFRESEAWKHEN